MLMFLMSAVFLCSWCVKLLKFPMSAGASCKVLTFLVWVFQVSKVVDVPDVCIVLLVSAMLLMYEVVGVPDV